MNRAKPYRFFLAALCAPAFAFSAQAAPATFSAQQGNAFGKPSISTQSPITPGEPVFLEASHLDYDQENDIVTAYGNVEIAQGETIMLADRLIYDQANNKVVAEGNISMLEPSGSVYFADRIELSDNLKTGVIRQFSARLSDDSLFAASAAARVDENTIELTRAVYSPCKVACDKDGSTDSPMWQIATDHAVIDQEEHRAVYDDTYFEVFGVPILYTPYFAHSLPGAENESGFLIPQYRYSNNIGTVVSVPYYYVIGQDRDVVVTPIFTGNEGIVMAGEYRQKYDFGQYFADGSITCPQDRDNLGNEAAGNEIRGHINATGEFLVDDKSLWGFDVHRATDDTYLRRYGFGEDTLLTSKIYGETTRFVDDNERSFARLQGVSFQGLTAQDRSKITPVALPLADVNYESRPGWHNSRFSADGNALLLTREEGTDSRRLSSRLGWTLPYISDDGQVIEFTTQLRSDVYEVSNVLLSDGRMFDGTTGRMVPEASLSWRFPFISQRADSSLLLEPIVELALSPGGGNTEKIPNEDSLIPEFTDTNLFSTNRYSGFDRIETGPRASYGLRGQAQFYYYNTVDWLIGQHYRVNPDRNFPFTNDLTSHFSDYVGKVGVTSDPFIFAYRFRFDKDTLSPKRQEVDTVYTYGYLSVGASYLSLQNDPILDTKEEIVGNAALKLTEYWTFNVAGRRDLELDLTSSSSVGLMFQNECASINTQIGRTFTRDRDIKPSTSVIFTISLKNLE